jgi:hypothetical protein
VSLLSNVTRDTSSGLRTDGGILKCSWIICALVEREKSVADDFSLVMVTHQLFVHSVRSFMACTCDRWRWLYTLQYTIR